MSEIQVGQINSTDGSTAITTGADGYVSFAKTQIGGRRNLIINGAMQVAQRGTSTFTMPSSSAYGLVDRYKFQEVSGGAMTVDISTDVPTGFKNSIKFTVTSADTDGLDAADRCTMDHRIEGQNMTQLAQGTSNATGFTFSFWVKSSVTGTFGGAFANSSVNRSYPYTYTINSANTWEYKTISVDGDTTGTWATDNTTGMFVWFSFGVGSTRSGTAGSWQSADYRNATGTVNLIENSGATFYITGVQLEVGTVATPFEHRSYGEELALCQRYFAAYNTSYFTHGIAPSSAYVYLRGAFSTPMRASPTGTVEASGTTYQISDDYSASHSSTTITGWGNDSWTNSQGCRVSLSGFTGLTVGRAYSGDRNATGLIFLDAEL